MAGSQMSKANQRQSGRHKSYYTAGFDRTKLNKARKLWATLKRNPTCSASLGALQKLERTVITRAGLPLTAPEIAHQKMAAETERLAAVRHEARVARRLARQSAPRAAAE